MPRLSRISAMPLMPMPPMPIKCTCCEVANIWDQIPEYQRMGSMNSDTRARWFELRTGATARRGGRRYCRTAVLRYNESMGIQPRKPFRCSVLRRAYWDTTGPPQGVGLG